MENTARHIIDALGKDALLSAHRNITPRTVADWRAKNTIAAQWFDLIETMCIERGIDCPRSAFSFKVSE